VEIAAILDKNGNSVEIEEATNRGWLIPQANGSVPDDNTNLFLDQGRQVVAYAFGFRSPIYNYTVQKFSVGTGLTSAKVTDVALEAPVTLSNGLTTKAIDCVDFLSPFVVRVSFTLGLSDANGYLLSEMGLLSGGDVLIARKVRAVSINKTSDFSPVFSWRLRF
jgi:hypothetical protein